MLIRLNDVRATLEGEPYELGAVALDPRLVDDVTVDDDGGGATFEIKSRFRVEGADARKLARHLRDCELLGDGGRRPKGGVRARGRRAMRLLRALMRQLKGTVRG